MHPNPAFRQTPREDNLALARERGFGTLAVNHADGPLLSHIPFVLGPDGAWLDAHLVRSNPIVPLLSAPCPAVVAVLGGDAYVSPDWYGIDEQVPTWNYVAVHLRGTLSLRAPETLRAHLAALSAANEARLAPKPAWTLEKMSEDGLARMMRMIVPVRLDVTGVDGTWKLSQNKPAEAQSRAGRSVSDGHGLETGWIAGLMAPTAD